MTPSSSRHVGSGPAAGTVRTGGLRFRGRTGPVPARVCWPARAGRTRLPALFVVFHDSEGDREPDDPWPSVCTRIDAVVVSTIGLPPVGDAPSLLGWAAEHADQLGADPHRLVVAGTGRGARYAAVAALQARDDGWPPVTRQLMIQPEFHTSMAGLWFAGSAPVTFTTLDGESLSSDGRRCASELARAGVPVEIAATEDLFTSLYRDLS